MKYVEIITLRSLAEADKRLIDELLHQLVVQKDSGFPASIRIYHHSIVETDLSIHILWDAEDKHPSKSLLGQRLAYALKGLGLLNHSLWVEAAALE